MSTRNSHRMVWSVGITLVAASVAGCGAGDSGSGGGGDSFPDDTIEIVVGFAAGGSTDTSVRALAAEAEETCDTNVIISNQPGSSGAIALDAVANAEPDGYTLATTATELSLLHHLGISDVTHEDFAAVMRYALDPHGLFTSPDSPYDTLDDVIAAAESGTTINVATAGTGGVYHLAMEAIALDAGVSGSFVNVPFDGDANAIPAAIRGEADLVITPVNQVLDEMEAGDLVGLASFSEERVDIAPDLPTLVEQGIDWTSASVYGLAAPAGTPEERVAALDECFSAAFESEGFQSFMEDRGITPAQLGHEEFDEYLRESSESFGEVIDATGMTAG
ncbi:tripartite tricarboxylate transporter substrate binding protein [Blastococcus sp. HT6-30]|uniref:tripartite tricarboxylate transporter substrate binding protein n=1 Tax=Blastococcus sp. HT6-30 TaxID=3144843 RepID=UPI00321A1BAA